MKKYVHISKREANNMHHFTEYGKPDKPMVFDEADWADVDEEAFNN